MFMGIKTVKKITVILVIVAFALLFCACGNADVGTQLTTTEMQKTGDGQSATVVTPTEVVQQDDETEYVPFIPEIIDLDPDSSYDSDSFENTTDYSNYAFSQVYGSFEQSGSENSIYTAQRSWSLAVCQDEEYPFSYGTLSADVQANGSDSGIVFGLDTTTYKDSFWEGLGISYYFYFVSVDGFIYLGKTVDTNWYALMVTSISDFSSESTYNVKIVYKGNRILCFLDDVYVGNYSDSSPLDGTSWGIRAGSSGAVISNINISNDFIY